MVAPSPPPVRGVWREGRSSFDPSLVVKAVETVKAAMPLFAAGTPLIRRGPAGELHVDVPVMYMNFAIDRIHYDPYSGAPSPKGRPVRAWGVEVNPQDVQHVVENALKEAHVIEAAEYREPEDAWAVPVAWKGIIIMHVKVSYNGEEIIPDYGLTEEIRRYIM